MTNQKTSKIDINYIEQNTDLVVLALEYGLDLIEQATGDYSCVCPFHDDTEPSMRIYTETDSYHCFGCNAGSSVFDFVMQYDNISFKEALYKLAARLGYSGTYILRKVIVKEELGNFPQTREKIELAILKKFSDIYKNTRKLKIIPLKDLFFITENFWAWYNHTQYLFDKKLADGVESTVLEKKLYNFYACSIRRLEKLQQ